MRKNKKWTADQKLEIVLSSLNGERSLSMISKQYGCNKRMLQRWISAYRQYGSQGLQKSKEKTIYTDSFKRKLVDELLSGQSQSSVLRKYKINPNSHALLSVWMKEYTSGIKYTSRGRYPMSKGRKTTLEERLAIVKSALDSNKDYHQTAETYKVSYQQVYGWVRKYELEGKDGLIDRRGQKSKSVGEMSDVERLEHALKAEQLNSRRLQMENDYLKKLKEIEQTMEDYR
ncbi:transposase-like protein [Streptohalobacillus salinus]|uniref:Transposase-like protein n=1 Tax=Streptohalobacillus salinus TaxID=621096 RepID=A0A2V3WAA1_9BACI|nr:helix-turn-helix domain-containing protein [Streptohalobacillus salinus]PXW85689.1 transposase-like protein [Streptohalobacillus salinus]